MPPGERFRKIAVKFPNCRADRHREMDEPDSQDPMVEAIAIGDAPERECLRPDEIGPAFEALSPDDKQKLHAIEAIRRRGTGFGKGELLREAIYRALDGDRQCPREVPIIVFLAMTMKSIASHAREQGKRLVTVADPPEPAQTDSSDPPLAPSPEGDAIVASVLRDIYAHLENDEEATLVVMGWAEELRGKALRDETGLDQAGLDYAAKRIRAVARQLYPDGWKT
jgi:hypothetical protein